jgi:Concanavalin A-like lectin/glucanases superfamily
MSDYSDLIIAEPGLRAYYRLNEPSGSTMSDSGPNGLNGTYDATNPPTLNQTGLLTSEGTSGKCALFDGVNDRAAVADNSLLDFDLQDFTLEAWVKPTTVGVAAGGNEHRWLGKGTVGVAGYSAGRTLANPSFFNMGHTVYTFSNYTLVAGTVYHMVFTISGDATNTVTCFINGAQIAAPQTGASAMNATSDPLRIGVSDAVISGEAWDGQIQHVALYNRRVTEDKIYRHYITGIAALTAQSSAASAATSARHGWF